MLLVYPFRCAVSSGLVSCNMHLRHRLDIPPGVQLSARVCRLTVHLSTLLKAFCEFDRMPSTTARSRTAKSNGMTMCCSGLWDLTAFRCQSKASGNPRQLSKIAKAVALMERAWHRPRQVDLFWECLQCLQCLQFPMLSRAFHRAASASAPASCGSGTARTVVTYVSCALAAFRDPGMHYLALLYFYMNCRVAIHV